jgi:hypothetical protein
VQRQQEAADREELLARAALGRQAKSEMDEEAAVAGHVTRSRRYLADMFDQGSSILANMAGNRERIKVCGRVRAVCARGGATQRQALRVGVLRRGVLLRRLCRLCSWWLTPGAAARTPASSRLRPHTPHRKRKRRCWT